MQTLQHVKGYRELAAALRQLPEKLERSVMRSGLQKGAIVMRDDARARVPKKTSQLAQEIKVSARILRSGLVVATVKTTGKHGYLAPWIEYGTGAHKILPKRKFTLIFAGLFSRGVTHPGSRPYPFMRPAMDLRANDALIAVGNEVKRRLAKEGFPPEDVEVEVEV